MNRAATCLANIPLSRPTLPSPYIGILNGTGNDGRGGCKEIEEREKKEPRTPQELIRLAEESISENRNVSPPEELREYHATMDEVLVVPKGVAKDCQHESMRWFAMGFDNRLADAMNRMEVAEAALPSDLSAELRAVGCGVD